MNSLDVMFFFGDLQMSQQSPTQTNINIFEHVSSFITGRSRAGVLLQFALLVGSALLFLHTVSHYVGLIEK